MLAIVAALQLFTAEVNASTLTVRKQGAVLWKRRVLEGDPRWSPSGQALVSLDRDWTLIYWRNGGPVQKFKLKVPFPSGLGELPDEPPLWSRDEKAILFRVFGSQGNESMNIGALMCFEPAKGNYTLISDSASHARWVGDNSVFYEAQYPREGATPRIEQRLWKRPAR